MLPSFFFLVTSTILSTMSLHSQHPDRVWDIPVTSYRVNRLNLSNWIAKCENVVPQVVGHVYAHPITDWNLSPSQTENFIKYVSKIEQWVWDLKLNKKCSNCGKGFNLCTCVIKIGVREADEFKILSNEEELSIEQCVRVSDVNIFLKRIHKVKQTAYMLLIRKSNTQHHRKLYEFIKQKHIKYGGGDDHRKILYVIVLFRTQKIYIGETGCGWVGRLGTHISAVAGNNTGFLHQEWRRLGYHLAVVLPLGSMETYGAKRRHRLREELKCIDQWGAAAGLLNIKGTERNGVRKVGERRVYEILPNNKGQRPFKHQRKKIFGRRFATPNQEHLSPEIFDAVSSLVRRPFKSEYLHNTRVFLDASIGKLSKVYRLATRTLDSRQWSFFQRNFEFISNLRSDVRKIAARIRNPLIKCSNVPPSIVNLFSNVINFLYRGAFRTPVLCILKLEIIPTGSKTVADLLVNVNKFASAVGNGSEVTRCVCNEERFSRFHKLQNHIIERWSEVIKNIPDGWNIRTRLLPNGRWNRENLLHDYMKICYMIT